MIKQMKLTTRKKAFIINHWLLTQKANYLTKMADQAIEEYKRKNGLK